MTENPQIKGSLSADFADFHRLNEKKKYPFADITYAIIGAAMAVHTELGPGFLEAVYHEALAIEMRHRNILFLSEPQVDIHFKELVLEKKYNPDFLVSNAVVVEIKALSKLSSIEESQIINALKASRKKVGLLINFGASSLEFRRFICENGKVARIKKDDE